MISILRGNRAAWLKWWHSLEIPIVRDIGMACWLNQERHSSTGHGPAGDYEEHQDRKKKQVLPRESNESLKEVSERGCNISILGDAQNSNQIKPWAIWSTTEIRLHLGREWGSKVRDPQRSLLPCRNLWLSHSEPPVTCGRWGFLNWMYRAVFSSPSGLNSLLWICPWVF